MKIDKDLEFLKYCSHKDLNTLVQILIYDKDGKKRWSESLHKEYEQYSPHHNKYWDKIATELQCYGGNTLMNIVRSGNGIPYREILEDVCDKYKVKYSKDVDTEELEDKLMIEILEESLDRMDDNQRKELLQTLGVKATGISTQATVAGMQLAVKQGGFSTYKMAVVLANSVSKKLLGKGLTLVGNQTLTKSISTLSGPIGWAITGAWTLNDIAGPAYRVTIPAVLEVMYLRRKYKSFWQIVLAKLSNFYSNTFLNKKT